MGSSPVSARPNNTPSGVLVGISVSYRGKFLLIIVAAAAVIVALVQFLIGSS
jgi:hypothetical protein